MMHVKCLVRGAVDLLERIVLGVAQHVEKSVQADALAPVLQDA